MKMKNSTFAIAAAVPMIPQKPRAPAISAMIRNMTAHLNMVQPTCEEWLLNGRIGGLKNTRFADCCGAMRVAALVPASIGFHLPTTCFHFEPRQRSGANERDR